MIRQIIQIDEELCNGCGLCVDACHESAIGLVDGKAKLLRDDYCDGLGNCLPVCPTNAITFIEREALEYNEEEVKRNMEKAAREKTAHFHGGCPGSMAKAIVRPNSEEVEADRKEAAPVQMKSRLGQWPVQIQLVPVNAPYFDGANLLIAADCTAFSYANFHEDFMKNKITIIGCPKLDEVDYSEKLTQIIKNNNIKSITITRMEVPCCGGIVNAVKQALIQSGKMIPWQVVIISTEGEILDI
ncbi:4Fe-4S binding protein [Mobilisporobacter senegalensis]|uniref:4Fe-4S binding protein n=1 Tax=Mobilisporobacter senegalensis TaxID=1329262 RepID=A0A3N1XZ31_9FIRM|nr:4Fe-4S binding protein [Mobilisporobacter senegalensis]ROR31866.1 4Fe-4S binding protein [Mobilisporobacter senegalensis]